MGNYDVKFDILECAREERVRLVKRWEAHQ
jgi:hypothetical protein